MAWEVPTPMAKEPEPLGDPYRPLPHGGSLVLLAAAELYGKAGDSAR